VSLNLDDGYVDESFNYGSGLNAIAYDVIESTSNQYMIGGSFTTYNGNTTNKLMRLNSDGSIDNSFTSYVFSGENTPIVTKIVELSDGSFYASGRWSSYGGVISYDNIFVYPDGTLDTDYLTQTQNTESGSGFVVDALQYVNKLISVGSYERSSFLISNTVRYGQYALNTKV
jgi:site-specific DNA-adenine methylase